MLELQYEEPALDIFQVSSCLLKGYYYTGFRLLFLMSADKDSMIHGCLFKKLTFMVQVYFLILNVF